MINFDTFRLDAADNLDAAVKVIETRDWCQGHFMDRGGRVCADAAIVAAAEESHEHGNGWNAAVTANELVNWLIETKATEHIEGVTCKCGTGNCNKSIVWYWNDKPGRTKDDVVNGLQKAANWLREKVD